MVMDIEIKGAFIKYGDTEGTKPWTKTTSPLFENLKCFILPGAFYGATVRMMAEAGFKRANTIPEADLVVFIGGADVSPHLYGQKPLDCVYSDKDRDNYEKAIFEECYAKNKPMFGICRGAQFLHVMLGGELWQDINNHAGPNHAIVDLDTDHRIISSSMHHQALVYNYNMELVAVTENPVATVFRNEEIQVGIDPNNLDHWHEIEVEAAIYHNDNCFLVQGHPEVGPQEYTSWAMHRLHNFLFDKYYLDDSVEDIGMSEGVKV